MARAPKVYGYIRFSNEEQERGDSISRQSRKITEFARRHNLPPPDLETYRDLGKSAYSGANVAKGSALFQFLADMDEGTVGKGDWLIVENLDRLSRQSVGESLQLLFRITNPGVTVATVHDETIFQKGKFDSNTVYRAATAADLGNRESAKKSVRVCEGFAGKRAKIAEGIKMTARCPGWLRLPGNPKKVRKFSVIPDRAAIVRRIFKMNNEGKGKRLIAQTLNAEKVPSWKKKGAGWSAPTIRGILESSAVIGEFTPCVMKDGERVPAGEPIKGYFPAIVPESDFFAAQAVSKNRAKTSGRVASSCNNLFSSLCFCGQCGGKVHYVNKARGARYLRCDRSARRLSKCSPANVRYDYVEELILEWVVKFDFTESTKTERIEKEAALEVADGRAGAAERAIARHLDALEKSSEAVEIFVHKVEQAKRERDAAKATARQLRTELLNLKEKAFDGDVQKLAKDPALRFRLREGIRKRFEKITINFGPIPGVDSRDPSFAVNLKDGSCYLLGLEESPFFWDSKGKLWRVDHAE